MKNVILTSKQIEQKTKRIAYQIYEDNYNEKEIVISGIASNGYYFAERIVKQLNAICDIHIILCKMEMDKKNPLKGVHTNISLSSIENKSVVLIDDVLNSGTTIIYGIKYFLEVSLKRFKTAVLVDRNHKKYPVKINYKGISLSTSIQEHVTVDYANNEAYLT